MEKREKILAGILVAALLYGAYAFLGADENLTTVAEMVNKDELTKTIDNVKKISSKNELTDYEKFTLLTAERGWANDPFYERPTVVEEEDDGGSQMPEDLIFVYNGYVELGKELYAIVNGMEYLEGDELDMEGVEGIFVKSVSKAKVVVGPKDDDGVIVGQMEIFLEEQDTF